MPNTDKTSMVSMEQLARDLLERLNRPRAQDMTAGQVRELADLIHAARAALAVLEKVEYGGSGEDCPVCHASLYGKVPHRRECTMANAIRLLRLCVPVTDRPVTPSP